MRLVAVGFLLAWRCATAQVPAILVEACSQMEPAAKRVECLQAANQAATNPPVATRPAPPTTQSLAAVPTPTTPTMPVAPAPSSNFTTSGSATCYVGPRGGTYTITRSGKKNYSGC